MASVKILTLNILNVAINAQFLLLFTRCSVVSCLYFLMTLIILTSMRFTRDTGAHNILNTLWAAFNLNEQKYLMSMQIVIRCIEAQEIISYL